MLTGRTNVGNSNYGQICSRLFPLRAETIGVAGVISTLRKTREIDLPIIAIPHARLGFMLHFLILCKNRFLKPKRVLYVSNNWVTRSRYSLNSFTQLRFEVRVKN